MNMIGQGKPLVLLHGWGWHSAIWDPLIPYLCEHYQLFLIDLPGCGKSPLTISDYSFENIAQLIFPRIPDNCSWLGWSLGGMLAWWIAIHYPHKVNKLITVSSSPCFVKKDNWPGVPTSTLEKFSQSLLSDPRQTLRNFLELQLRGNNKSKLEFHLLENKMFSQLPVMGALEGGLQLLRETDLRKDLHRVEAPSLHIYGSIDTLVPASITSTLKQETLHAQYEIISRAGHIPFLTHLTEFLTLTNSL